MAARRGGALAMVLTLAVPGLGHLVGRRRTKALLFFVTILGTYGFGWGVTRGESVSFHRHPLVLAAEAGAAGPTALALLASRSRDTRRWIDALVEMGSLEPGQAGEIPLGGGRSALWATLQRDAGLPEKVLEEAYWRSTRRANPRLDVGVLYVMVAGLLNLLVAMDAAEGPRRRPRRSSG